MDTLLGNVPYGENTLKINEAINGYKIRMREKGKPAPTGEELQAFINKISASIAATTERNARVQEKLDKEFNEREDRRDFVLVEAASLGVKFLHHRVKMRTVTMIDSKELYRTRSRSVSEDLMEVVENKSPYGGETIAFIYKLDDENKLSMLYSVAFCRPDEKFDDIIGMEESLKKFKIGKVVEMPLTHDRLGDPKLILMGREFRSLHPTRV